MSRAVIVLGGANCEGVMGAETVRQFSFVDAVVSGEGDSVFPELVQRALNGSPLSELQGVQTRQSISADFEQGRFTTAPPIRNMDELPVPNFDDYFAEFAASKYGGHGNRICSWKRRAGAGGARRCTAPSAASTARRWLSEQVSRSRARRAHGATKRYPGCDIQVVDNILDMNYFKTLLPELASTPA